MKQEYLLLYLHSYLTLSFLTLRDFGELQLKPTEERDQRAR